MTVHAPALPAREARGWALSGAALAAVGVVVVLALHVLAPENDPVRRTL